MRRPTLLWHVENMLGQNLNVSCTTPWRNLWIQTLAVFIFRLGSIRSTNRVQHPRHISKRVTRNSLPAIMSPATGQLLPDFSCFVYGVGHTRWRLNNLSLHRVFPVICAATLTRLWKISIILLRYAAHWFDLATVHIILILYWLVKHG